jgi:hypothetical protein
MKLIIVILSCLCYAITVKSYKQRFYRSLPKFTGSQDRRHYLAKDSNLDLSHRVRLDRTISHIKPSSYIYENHTTGYFVEFNYPGSTSDDPNTPCSGSYSYQAQVLGKCIKYDEGLYYILSLNVLVDDNGDETLYLERVYYYDLECNDYYFQDYTTYSTTCSYGTLFQYLTSLPSTDGQAGVLIK